MKIIKMVKTSDNIRVFGAGGLVLHNESWMNSNKQEGLTKHKNKCK